MSRAQLFADAIDTLITLGWAAAGWLAVAAAVITVVLFAGTAVGAWGVRALWRHTVGPSWRRGRLRARIFARTRTRAADGHTGARDYQEAA